MSASKEQWPALPSDEAAEAFVATADLMEFDWSAAEPVRYELGKKAAVQGIYFTRYVRTLIEQALGWS